MRLDVHVHFNFSPDLLELLTQIKEIVMTTQEGIDKLKADVAAQTTVIQSLVTLVNGLAQQIRDSADDPAELQALADGIEANTAAIAKAVTDNTPATPVTPPTP